MALNINYRVRNKQDYQIGAIASGITFVLSIIALVVYTKREGK